MTDALNTAAIHASGRGNAGTTVGDTRACNGIVGRLDRGQGDTVNSMFPGLCDGLSRTNAAFIAAARADVPALCDEVDKLRAALHDIAYFDGKGMYGADIAATMTMIACKALEFTP